MFAKIWIDAGAYSYERIESVEFVDSLEGRSPCSGAQQFCSFTCDNGGNASATCSSTGQWQITELGSCDGDAGLDAGDGGD
jgi:hypothetical protein